LTSGPGRSPYDDHAFEVRADDASLADTRENMELL
jgi:hypothetical protein